MTDQIAIFNQELDALLNRVEPSTRVEDPLLRIAAQLNHLDLSGMAKPPAALRERWMHAAGGRPHIPVRLLRRNPVYSILLAVLMLILLAGVVYALGNWFGYWPGLGVVDQSSPLLVLSQPLSQQRDGVTLTVESAVLSTDNAVITYKVSGLSPNRYSELEPENTCASLEMLRFDDGTVLQPDSATLEPAGESFSNVLHFSGIPTGVRKASLIVPCIQGARSVDSLPVNWIMDLNVVPASAEMVLTLVPVIDLPATVAPEIDDGAISTGTPTDSTGIPTPQEGMTITRVIKTENSTILIGQFNPPAPQGKTDWIIANSQITITDATGAIINYQPPQDISLPEPAGDHQSIWSLEISEAYQPPLKIEATSRLAYPAETSDTVQVEFDAGENPQLRQVWQMNRDLEIAGHTFRLRDIKADLKGFFFNFTSSDPELNQVSVDIAGLTPDTSGGSTSDGIWTMYRFYSEMPSGKLTLIIHSPYLTASTGTWAVEWQP